ncbi:unnamed protein product, partial [Fusarium fujikuroi]
GEGGSGSAKMAVPEYGDEVAVAITLSIADPPAQLLISNSPHLSE